MQAVLHAGLEWIGRHVRGLHAAMGVALGTGAAVVLLSVWAFAALAEWVLQGETQRWDEAMLRRVHAHTSPLLDMAAQEITALGATLVVIMLVLVASVLLWISRHRYSVLLLWVSVLGASLLNHVLKDAFSRPRPSVVPWRAEYATATSFPSGHSMTAMAAYATLAYLVARLSPTRALWWATTGVALLVIVLIGVSRVYLGVHYPTDVAAGFLSGFAWAALSALGIEALRHFRARHPEVEAAEEDLDAGGGDLQGAEA